MLVQFRSKIDPRKYSPLLIGSVFDRTGFLYPAPNTLPTIVGPDMVTNELRIIGVAA